MVSCDISPGFLSSEVQSATVPNQVSVNQTEENVDPVKDLHAGPGSNYASNAEIVGSQAL